MSQLSSTYLLFVLFLIISGLVAASTLPWYTFATTTATTSISSEELAATSTIPAIVEAITTERTPSIAQNRSQLRQIRTDNPVLTARTQERFLNLGANASNRMEATVERLQQITDRLERRLEREAEANIDVTSSRRALEAANLALETAREALSDIDSHMHTFVFSQNPRESWGFTRGLYMTAQQNIIDAHTALRISINELIQASTAQPEVISE